MEMCSRMIYSILIYPYTFISLHVSCDFTQKNLFKQETAHLYSNLHDLMGVKTGIFFGKLLCKTGVNEIKTGIQKKGIFFFDFYWYFFRGNFKNFRTSLIP